MAKPKPIDDLSADDSYVEAAAKIVSVRSGAAVHCDGNVVPDSCELPSRGCNTSGIVDFCDIRDARSRDCQPNLIDRKSDV